MMNKRKNYRILTLSILAISVILSVVYVGCSRVVASDIDNHSITYPEGFNKLVFDEEFNYRGVPDTTKWSFEEGYIRNGEMQYYTEGLNVWCSDSTLVIESRLDNSIIDGDTIPVTSGSVTTSGKGAWKDCFVEVRAKLPSFRGSWPAIWMMPSESRYGKWPQSGEIDILEHVGHNPDRIHFSAHSERYNHMRSQQTTGSIEAPEATDGFHIYGLKRTEDIIVWYYDGKEVFKLEKEKDADWTSWPFDEDFYLILNLAVGGSWGGQKGVDLGALPARFEIDYVRVFEK